MDKLNKVIKSANSNETFRFLKSLFPFILLMSVILSWKLYIASEKTINTIKLKGTLVGVHQVQSHLGGSSSQFAIQLEDGKLVRTNTSKNTPFFKDKKVNIIQSVKESGRIYYSFDGYVEND